MCSEPIDSLPTGCRGRCSAEREVVQVIASRFSEPSPLKGRGNPFSLPRRGGDWAGPRSWGLMLATVTTRRQTAFGTSTSSRVARSENESPTQNLGD